MNSQKLYYYNFVNLKKKKKISTNGPLVINLLASIDFYNYQKGLFVDKNCDDAQGFFSLVLIGYGKVNNREFWLLGYSLGLTWGMDGFMQLPKVSGNKYCGVHMMPLWITF